MFNNLFANQAYIQSLRIFDNIIADIVNISGLFLDSNNFWNLSNGLVSNNVTFDGFSVRDNYININSPLNIYDNIVLAKTSSTNKYGIIYKETEPFIHDFNYGDNGTVTTYGNNTFVGINAGNFIMGSTATSAIHGSDNTAVGHNSLQSNTIGYCNCAYGMNSLRYNTEGYNNVAIGEVSLYRNTKGRYNTAVGNSSLYENILGHSNTAIGLEALNYNVLGSYNNASGYQSLFHNTFGSYNTAYGYRSLYYTETTGKAITSFSDYSSVVSNTVKATSVSHGLSGNVDNIRIAGTIHYNGVYTITVIDSDNFYFSHYWLGEDATGWWTKDTEGRYNTALGYKAGDNITIGSNNIIIGANIDAPSATGDNQLNIGDIIYGELSSKLLGVNNSLPQTELHVNGIGAFTDLLLPNYKTGSNQQISFGKLFVAKQSWSETYVSPNLTEHQGYATDGVYHYLFHNTLINKRDRNWNVVVSVNPFDGLTGYNHAGDGDYYNGKLYVPIEYWVNCSSTTKPSIAVYNAENLSRESVIDVSDYQSEVSSITVVPDQGESGWLIVTSFCISTEIYKYDLSNFSYLGAITLSENLTNIQGITYKNGLLYIVTDNNDKINLVTLDGIVIDTIYTTTNNESEGIDYSQDEIRWLYKDTSNNMNVHYIKPTSNKTMVAINPSSGQIEVLDGDVLNSVFVANAYSNVAPYTAGFLGRRARGTYSNPSGVTNGDVLAGLYGRGYNGTDWSLNSAAIRLVASETYTGVTIGSYIDFATTTNGTASRTVKMILDNAGRLGIGVLSNLSYKLEVDGTIKSTGLIVSGITTFNNVQYTWPSSDGNNGNVLSTNGSGELSWISVGGGGNMLKSTYDTNDNGIVDYAEAPWQGSSFPSASDGLLFYRSDLQELYLYIGIT